MSLTTASPEEKLLLLLLPVLTARFGVWWGQTNRGSAILNEVCKNTKLLLKISPESCQVWCVQSQDLCE